MEDFINWVNKQMVIKKLSQRALAEKGGVSHTLISDTLRGDSPITFGFCKAVSRGLNEPVWNVLIMAGMLDEVAKDLAESEEIRILVQKYNQLSGPVKDELQRYLDWLILK